MFQHTPTINEKKHCKKRPFTVGQDVSSYYTDYLLRNTEDTT